MTDAHTLEDAIKEWLDPIDRFLAERGMPPDQRPMHAAIELVSAAVERVSEDGDTEGVKPGRFPDYAASKWFRIFVKAVQEWYRERYGAAMDKPEKALDATIHIVGTPFLMRIPTTTKEPGEPGVTVWLCFHDRVRAEEDPLIWVRGGPNLAALPSRDVSKARTEARAIGTRLRSIYIQLMQMDSDDPQTRQLRDGILPHLEGAARALVSGTPEQLKAAHWDMQMGCERALKCLAQQRAGTFTETHDLFVLYDRTPGAAPAFKRSELTKLPRWERMIDLRYGGGPPIAAREAYRAYRATLAIIDGALSGLRVKVRMGSAKFLLQAPPWLKDM